jgi:hypothetical protein
MPGAHLLGRTCRRRRHLGRRWHNRGLPIDPRRYNRHVAKFLLLLRVFPRVSMELPTAVSTEVWAETYNISAHISVLS